MGITLLPRDVNKKSNDDVDKHDGHDGGVNCGRLSINSVRIFEDPMFGDEETDDRSQEEEE